MSNKKLFSIINNGLIKCGDGVTIKIGRQHISYIKGDHAITVEIERMIDHKVHIYVNPLNCNEPIIENQTESCLANEIIKTIEDVLCFIGQDYELVD